MLRYSEDGGCGLEKFNNFSLFLWPDVSLSFGKLFQGLLSSPLYTLHMQFLDSEYACGTM